MRSLKVVRRGEDTRGEHARAFLGQLEALYAYARRLVGSDRHLADDLIQDAYIQFTLARPDLAAIADLRAYLVRMVRNLHVSWIRRTAASRRGHLPVEEYDSVELALAASSVDTRLRAREGLVGICHYIRTRTDTSKTASVLALRFFHGLYPSEIARLIRSNPRVVNSWLWQARNEARAFLAKAHTSRPVASPGPPPIALPLSVENPADIVAVLREAIFAVRRPPCPTATEIMRRYERPTAPPLDVASCSHLASCRTCLDRACRVLGMPLLDSRYPMDPKDPDDSDDAPPVALSGRRFQRAAERRARDVIEHRPKELRISVNGHDVGVLGVTSARNAVRFTLRLDEPVAFAELHSEQGLRLALLDVIMPPEGVVRPRLHVALSDERFIDLAIDFSELHPAVAVEYSDPLLRPADEGAVAFFDPTESPGVNPLARAPGSRWQRLTSWWSRRGRAMRPSWIPLTATCSIAALAAFTTWLMANRGRTLDADALLEQAVRAEVEASLPAGRTIHRALELQVGRLGVSQAESTHRIDIWLVGGAAKRVVRVFDAAGHLVAGRWRGLPAGDTFIALGALDEIWQQDLSAEAFRDRYARQRTCTAVDDAHSRTITCEGRSSTLNGWLYPTLLAATETLQPTRASLSLRRADLHAIRQVLTVQLGGAERTITLAEERLDVIPSANIPADVLAPPTSTVTSTSSTAKTTRMQPATRSLEMRVVEVLDRLAGNENVSMRKRADGTLIVAGLLPTSQLKRALTGAVAALGGERSVAIDLQTFAEAAAGGASARARRAEFRELPVGPAAIEIFLRTRLADASAAPVVARQLTEHALPAAHAARRHAVALRSVVEQFPVDSLTLFDAAAQTAWRAIVSRHATALTETLATLDTALAPYFDAAAADDLAVPDMAVGATARLVHETAVIDESLTSALTVAIDGTGADVVPRDVRHHIQQALIHARALERAARQ